MYCMAVLSDGALAFFNIVQGFNPIALRKAKIVCNFGLSECNRVNLIY